MLRDTPENALIKLKKSKDYRGLAVALEIRADQFLFILRNADNGHYYKSFEIKKKTGGVRKIDKPLKGLALAQENFSQILNHLYKPKKFVRGYVKGESFISNARYHQRSRWILNVDIKDFFGTISFPRVRGLFTSRFLDCNANVATCLARICTYQNHLPQGAKTSPIIANLIAHHLDNQLVQIARTERIRFSRYADDITFSSTHKNIPISLVRSYQPKSGGRVVELGSTLKSAFRKARFSIKKEKTRLQFPHERMEVTGLIVNTNANNWRRDISRLRMKLHSANKFGDTEAAKLWLRPNATSGDFWMHIEGWLAYIRQVRGINDPVLAKLCKSASTLNLSLANWIMEQADMVEKYDVFLSHASEDKPKVRKLKEKLEEIGVTVFFDEKSIKWGDSIVEKINHGLLRSQLFVPCLSQNFADKGWTNRELNSAIQININRKTKILPIRLDEFEIGESFPLLNEILYKDWPSAPENEDELIENMAKLLKEKIEK